ncbi:SDR family NAD(P)-dependent oxidoreductase [Amycolatopsis rhizosphaerae]|uniref:SDR family NAD(P)-dependent oxidoreductase n=1 Tax=Amycolatopsis rhizosphaerae TaxID=2053003 RepID=A0A558CRZ5_9PSEU|nr:short-chain dehydrogenase/reductase [Amycolatopsis rhizosphaerae]TVT51531.1 SDR family NAD(P)-dependent oxidoreductase [Amycolatopsis rhizosphaerae]
MNPWRLFRPVAPVNDLDGQVALVTGGGHGIGRETAHAFAARGASVAVVDLDPAAAKKVAAEIGEHRALGIAADVRDSEALRTAVGEVLGRWDRLDVAVANAGVTPVPATVRMGDPADFERVVSVNLFGVLNTAQAVVEPLVQRRGHLVVVASAAAFCPPVGGAAYMVSKAAVEQLGRALRLELAPYGVTATVAYFGVVDTRLARTTLDDDPLGAALDAMLPRPLRRRISARTAAEVIVSAVENRSPRSMAPSAWEPLSWFRGIVNPVLDRVLVRDSRLHALIRDLEDRLLAG